MKTTTNRSFLIIAVSLLVLLVFSSAFALRPRPEVIRLHGDTQALAAVIFPIKERFEKETGVRIVTITEMPPVASLRELDSGNCDAVVAAMSFEALNDMADKAGIQRRNKALIQHLILYGDIDYRVIVHPQNPVAALTDKQLRKIFSGSYENWSDADGPDLPLSVVWGRHSTGSAWILADRIMDGAPLLEKTVSGADTAEIVAKVAAMPNSVAVVPQAAVNKTVKPVQATELKIKGPIIMVTVSFPQPPLFKLIKFLRDNGNRNIGF